MVGGEIKGVRGRGLRIGRGGRIGVAARPQVEMTLVLSWKLVACTPWEGMRAFQTRLGLCLRQNVRVRTILLGCSQILDRA